MRALLASLLLMISVETTADTAWQRTLEAIRDKPFPAVTETGVPTEKLVRCDDGIDRPYLYVIPERYDAARATPMLVYLHGLTNRPELIEDRVRFVNETPLTELAAEMGWIIVFPFSQHESNWFIDIGMNKINDIVTAMKRDFNIDDDRVWLGGFSDGGSASFSMSMLAADHFAGFLPLSGQMGVAARDTGVHLYPANMASSRHYVVNTGLDNLYPAKEMRKTVELANRAGANITFNEYDDIKHTFEYADAEMENFRRFLSESVREPTTDRIIWKTATPEHGRRLWLSIDAVSDGEAESWHVDHDMILTDERITVGFIPDWEFAGPGASVVSLVDGDTYARRAGLAAGDIITSANGTDITELGVLLSTLQTLRPESALSLTVQREGKALELDGKLNPVKRYPLFPRTLPSGMIDARYADNTFTVKTSRVDTFSLHIHPEMVDLASPVKVVWNGETVYDARVAPDKALLETQHASSGERKNLYVAHLTFHR